MQQFRSGAVLRLRCDGASESDTRTTETTMTTEPTAAATMNPAELALELYKLLSPFPAELRQRAIQSALTALGDSPIGQSSSLPGAGIGIVAGMDDFADLKLGPKALKWLQRHRISRTMIEEVFHITESGVEITASSVPGVSKREMTVNCYLLMGIRGLLGSDVPTLDDSETIALCKRLTAYDKNNHPTYRSAIGNKMTGAKPTFTLTGPGENAGADLIKAMASHDN